MNGDFHIHSKYSYDSIMEPRKILKICKKIGFDQVSITDHDSIMGSFEAKKYEKEFGLHVLCGEERLTDAGDIIGLDLTDSIKSKCWTDVFDEIKSQGGISILVHPYRCHKNPELLASYADIVEIWNSHSKPIDNVRATELAAKLKKPTVAGSDAHLYSEIGNVTMNMTDIFGDEKEFVVKYSTKYEKAISSVIGRIKSRI